MIERDVPSIPEYLRHVPTAGGLVIPWITMTGDRGQLLLGAIDTVKQRRCLVERRCQVCARELGGRLVLLLRDRDLERRCTSEPGMHPICAAYTQRACPMVAGQMTHYRRSLVKISEDRAHGAHAESRLGRPAEPWFAVWLNDYKVIADREAGTLAASFADIEPLKIRPVTP